MKVPTSVLCAVDFGEASRPAITVAGLVAARWNVPLRLLHAESIEAPPYFTHDQIDVLEQQRRQARAQAEQYLHRFGRQHTGYPFAVVVADGEPAAAIRKHAHDGDLMVMGTRGRRGPKRWWLGSVAERVLDETSHPLLVIRAAPIDRAELLAEIDRWIATATGHTDDRCFSYPGTLVGERS